MTANDLTFTIPSICANKNVILKVHNPEKRPQESKFQSFTIPVVVCSMCINIKGCGIPVIHLYRMLLTCGLGSTFPMRCSALDGSVIDSFEWNVIGYGGPTVRHFIWNDINCSITGAPNGHQLYLRVHDIMRTRIRHFAHFSRRKVNKIRD